MAVTKINFFFKQGKYGWSETYYADKPSLPEALDSAKRIRPFRTQLLGGSGTEPPRLDKIRVSLIGVAGDSLVEVVSDADGRVPGDGISFADIPSTALLVRAEASSDYRRQLYLRGQPDVLVTDNGRYVPLGTFPTTANIFFAALIREQWGILAATKPAPPLPRIQDITIVPTRPELAAVHTDPVAHGLVAGDKVRIVSAPGTTGVRGSWIVRFVPDTMTFDFNVGRAWTGSYRGGGTYYKKVYSLRVFTRLQIEGATRKATGVPFDRPHGRRRSRARV